MNSRAYNRVRHIHNRDGLDPDLIEFIERVLQAAAGDLQSNIFLFPDVHSEVNLASGEYGVTVRPGAHRLHDPCFDPFKEAVLDAVHSRGVPFPVMIWVSSRVLLTTVPVFRTGVLAHELGHARQIEHAEEVGEAHDVLDAWDCYKDFLTEKQQVLSYWKWPLEIDAELSARKVIKQLHPGESLDPLLNFYKGDYESVLEFESSGGFDLFEYFADLIRRDPSGFRQWVLTGDDMMCRKNVMLLRLAPE